MHTSKETLTALEHKKTLQLGKGKKMYLSSSECQNVITLKVSTREKKVKIQNSFQRMAAKKAYNFIILGTPLERKFKKTFIVYHPSINGKVYLMFQDTVRFFNDVQLHALRYAPDI